MRDVDTSTALDSALEVETFGAEETGAFSIAVNGKAFDILMKGLYSREIEAIVRELSTNAFDAHAMAGCADRPFRLVLPTRWDDRFAVRDYGTSLSHSAVMNLYTTVFKSTKDQSNAQVGKFGLGSKVPFAYSDQFTVTAWMDGEKRVYNAYRDVDRIPKISLFAREAVDHTQPGDEVGLEVSFPVQPQDVDAFTNAARRVLLGFDVKPDVASKALIATETKFAAPDGSWKVLKRTPDMPLPSAPYVRQGCVIYPVDIEAVSRVVVSKGLRSFQHELIIIDMPIGSVEVTPSRETLSYDPTTCQNIGAAFDNAMAHVVEQATQQLMAASTLWEANKRRLDVLATFSSYGSLRDVLLRGLKWRGRDLFDHITIGNTTLDTLRRHGCDIREARAAGAKGRTTSALNYATHPPSIRFDAANPYSMPAFFYWSGTESPKHVGYRYAAACAAVPNRHCYILPNFTPGGRAEAALRVAMGRPDKITFVDLAAVPYEKPDYTKTLAQVGVWNGGSFKPHSQPVDEDDANIYYVMTNRGDVVPPAGWRLDNHGVGEAFRILVTTGFLAPTSRLVNIPASRKSLANNIPGAWNDFLSVAEETVKQHLDMEKVSKFYAAAHSSYNRSPWVRLMTLVEQDPSGINSASSTLLEAIEKFAAFRADLDGDFAKQADLKHVADNLNLKALLEGFHPEKYTTTFNALVGYLELSYPMAALLFSDRYTPFDMKGRSFGHLKDYINLMDASREPHISVPANVSLVDMDDAA